MDFDKMMNAWLDSEEDWSNYKKEDSPPELSMGDLRLFLKKMPPEDEIDLHGRTIKESEHLLTEFIRGAAGRGLRKVLIIHGKGNHSKAGAVLSTWVKHFLDLSPACGETGHPDQRDGGKGATWVILK